MISRQVSLLPEDDVSNVLPASVPVTCALLSSAFCPLLYVTWQVCAIPYNSCGGHASLTASCQCPVVIPWAVCHRRVVFCTAVYASYIAVISGLGITLMLLALYRKALPALPVSIALGVLFYFLTRLVMEPFIVPLSLNLAYY